ncbi:MAG: hypothetical protein M3022_05830 [Actinomycetota bacterium]|nr:hypothetical protein [Actinomycetota bacterium]
MSPVISAAPARPRGAARREALLQAVLTIVAEVGADAVTHRRVAQVAGLPLASTTYWFDSKEHLLTAAIELAADRDIARIQALVEDRADGEDPIALAVSGLLEPLDDERPGSRTSLLAGYSLLLEAARRPALRAIAIRWSEAYTDGLATLLEAAGSRQARADAQLLMAAYDGLLLEQLAAGVSANLSSRLRRLTRALLEFS